MLPTLPVFSQPWRILGDSRANFPLHLNSFVSVSPDGKFLLSADYASSDHHKTLKRTLVLDATTGKLIRRNSAGSGRQHAFSPDSRLFYTTAQDRKVCVWELNSGKKLKEFKADHWALSADGKLLVLVETHPGFTQIDRFGSIPPEPYIKPIPPSSLLHFLDTTTWKEMGLKPAPKVPAETLKRLVDQLNSPRFVERDKAAQELLKLGELAETALANVVKKPPSVEAKRRAEDLLHKLHEARKKAQNRNVLISALASSNDGKTVAWRGAEDTEIRLVDVQSRKEIRKIQAPRIFAPYGLSSQFLAFAPDGKTLAAATDTKKIFGKIGGNESWDSVVSINLWDVQTGKEIKKLEAKDIPVRGLAYTPRGDKLIVITQFNTWSVFAMPSGELLEKKGGQRGYGDIVLSLYRQGRMPMAVSSPFLSYVGDLATGKDMETGDTPEKLGSLVALPDGKTVVTGEGSGYIRFWDLEGGKEIRRTNNAIPPKSPYSDAAVYGLAFSPAEKCLVSAHFNGDLKFWSADDGKPLSAIRHRFFGCQRMAVARNGTIAVVGVSGGGISLLPNRAARPDVVKIQVGAVSSMQFSEDSKLLLAVSWNGLHLIDVPGKKVLRVIEPDKRFAGAALSPDGKTLATLTNFGDGIDLRHLETGKVIGKFAVNPPPVAMNGFSPDGRSLLVHHRDGMHLWEVASGQIRYSAPAIFSQGLSPNGRLLYSLTEKQIFVWDLTGEQSGGVLKPVKHSPQTQADLWADLQSKVDAAKAYRAMWRLAADPEQTLPFLTEKVGAIGPIDPKVAKLKVYPFPPEKVLTFRIVELLEQIGTPEARRLLKTLATLAKPQFTDAARQALSRLAGK